MPDLKLAQLPYRTPVKLGISVMPDLHQALNDYAQAYGRDPGRGSHTGDARRLPRKRSRLQRGEVQMSLGMPPEEVNLEPISVRISTAVKLTGICRSTIYELIGDGPIETVKIGRSTFILYPSLKRLFERS